MNKVKTDFYIENATEWARVRSCGIIIENNCVLAITNKLADYYYSIGETSEDACIREVYEETGIHYTIDRLAFIHENFFVGEDNKNCHEIAFYYLMKSKGSPKWINDSFAMNGEKEILKWIPLNEYENYLAYPLFFKDELMKLSNGIKNIVTKEIDC